MSLLAGILLLFVSVYIGWSTKRRYDLNYNFIKSLFNFNKVMLEEVTYLKTSYRDIVNKFTGGNTTIFNEILIRHIKILDNNTYRDNQLTTLFDKIKGINSKEKNLVIQYLSTIGELDIYNQTKVLNYYEQVLSDRVIILKTECKEKGDLFFKLSIMFGILILILLV